MLSALRYLRPFFIFTAFCLAISGCDCSDDIADDGTEGDECEHSDDCTEGEECIDGVCVDPDDPVDAGSDADTETDPDADVDVDTGTDVGADTDTDVEPEPDCPDANTCAGEGVECGWIADGCGGTVDCGGCPDGYTCGVGDEQGQCVAVDCEPDATCEGEGVECGSIADGCGGMIDCGECGEDEICGVGPNAGQCVQADCQPLSCDDHSPGECGPHPDGCGGFLDCGTCPEGHSCEDGECEEIECEPLECDDLGNPECGSHPDGCGDFIDCGQCSGGLVCGTGSDLGLCVEHDCDPLTCADYPEVNCGQVPDGCGGLTANCGDCTSPEICGGGGIPNVCGAEAVDDCEGLCSDQAICTSDDPEDATTLTGTVYAPNGELPIPNAVVYVPNLDDIDDLPEIETGPVCEQCEDEELGNPLVGTTTEYDGTFELRHVPADVEFDLVIKIGDWRRVVTVGPFSPCETHQLTPEQTRLPTSQGEGGIEQNNIPKTAVSTGWIDAMECVLHKLGVESSQFTRHTQDGRIHLYRANGGVADPTLANACGDAGCDANTCTDRNPSCGGFNGPTLEDNLSHHLYSDQSTLNSYDMVIMDCEGANHSGHRTGDDLTRMRNYVNEGGRLFASHWAWDWLHQNDELQDAADYGGAHHHGGTYSRAYIDDGFPGGERFRDWLDLPSVDALYPTFGPLGQPQVEITDPRGLVVDVVDEHADRWAYTVSSDHEVNYSAVQQFTFNTPVHADEEEQCGQVAYSAFHVADVNIPHGPAFPDYCGSDGLTDQEKMLAYMLFDLAACVTADGEPPDPECEPLSCGDLGAECGMAADGCGGTIDCGDCPDPLICGAIPGEPNLCGEFCAPLSCDDHGAECGTVSDGCGGTIDCGECPDGEACGGGGVPNQCGCTPMDCDDHGAECGEISDGCGGTIDCGPCPDGEECGAGGTPNMCGGDCDELTCEDHGAECGTVADGCGGTLDCGECPEPDTCGGAGEANQCGCTPLSCEDHGAECGEVSDGCGDILDCGPCPDGVCVDNQCGCVGLGEPCDTGADCCSEQCGTGSDGEGVCILG